MDRADGTSIGEGKHDEAQSSVRRRRCGSAIGTFARGVRAATAAADEIRSAPEGRPCHRPEEPDQRGSRRGDRGRQGGGGRGPHQSRRGAESRRRLGPLRDARDSSTSTSTSTPAPASASSYAGDNSVYPDGFTLRNGVTTVVDAGCAGWRNFEEFKQRVIDRSRTRILAFLNIVGNGMRGGKFEQNLDDMEVEADGRHGAAPQGTHRRRQDRALLRARSGRRSSARSRRGRSRTFR